MTAATLFPTWYWVYMIATSTNAVRWQSNTFCCLPSHFITKIATKTDVYSIDRSKQRGLLGYWWIHFMSELEYYLQQQDARHDPIRTVAH